MRIVYRYVKNSLNFFARPHQKRRKSLGIPLFKGEAVWWGLVKHPTKHLTKHPTKTPPIMGLWWNFCCRFFWCVFRNPWWGLFSFWWGLWWGLYKHPTSPKRQCLKAFRAFFADFWWGVTKKK